MTEPTPTGAWSRAITSGVFRDLSWGLIASIVIGAAAGVLPGLTHWHLHLPGREAFFWLAFLSAAPFAARRHGSATVAGVTGAATLLVWSGLLPQDPVGLFVYPFTGALIDFAFDRWPNRVGDPLVVAGVGALAFTLASVIHAQWFVAHHGGHGLLAFAGFHLLFGFAGGALGAGVLQVFNYLRGRRSALATALLALLAFAGLRRARAGETLGTIVVRGQGALRHPSPGLTWHLSAHQIAAAGAVNLAQALALVPGLHLRVGAQGVPRLDVWGLQTRNIKLLINGVPVNSPYDGNFDPSLIPAADIAEIIVTTGDSSVLYGPGAMGGVINVITRIGTPEGWSGGIDAGGGSGNYRHEAGTLAGGGRGWNSFFMIDHGSRDSFPMSSEWTPTALQPSGQRVNSANQQNTLYGHSTFDVGKAGQIGLTVRRTTAAYGIPPSAFDSTTDPFASKPNYERIENLVDSLYQFSGLYAPGGGFAFRGWAYATNWHENDNRYDGGSYNSIADPAVKGTYLLYLATSSGGVHLQPSIDLASNQSLTFALDWHSATWRNQGVVRNVPLSGAGRGDGSSGGGRGGGGGGTIYYGLQNVNLETAVREGSAIAEYAVAPAPRVIMTLGASQNWQWRDMGPDQAIPGYDVAVHFRWTEATTLSASTGRKVQFPTLQELYDPESGNRVLSAQTVNVYQIGLDHSFSTRLSGSATTFLLDAHGFIQKNKSVDQYRNFNHYRMDGVQLNLDLRPSDTLFLVLNYTFLNARNVGNTPGVDQLQYRPRHQLAVQATWTPLPRLTLSGAGYYVADQVYYSVRGPVQKAYLPNYFVADVRIAYGFSQRLSGYGGVRNLFDRNYMDSYGFPAPGRFVYAGVQITIGQWGE